MFYSPEATGRRRPRQRRILPWESMQEAAPPSLVARLRQLASEDPDALACSHVAADGSIEAFTIGDLDRRSSQLAAALIERGLGFGDRVSIALRNSPELVISALASWKVGATPVPVRWDLPDWEL